MLIAVGPTSLLFQALTWGPGNSRLQGLREQNSPPVWATGQDLAPKRSLWSHGPVLWLWRLQKDSVSALSPCRLWLGRRSGSPAPRGLAPAGRREGRPRTVGRGTPYQSQCREGVARSAIRRDCPAVWAVTPCQRECRIFCCTDSTRERFLWVA